MKLTDLEPKFLKRENDHSFWFHTGIAEADGIEFLCPVCFQKNGGPVGTHAIICWTPQVPQTTDPVPGRWNMQGTSFADLSLIAGSSSVFLTTAACKAHFFVKSGEIQFC